MTCQISLQLAHKASWLVIVPGQSSLHKASFAETLPFPIITPSSNWSVTHCYWEIVEAQKVFILLGTNESIVSLQLPVSCTCKTQTFFSKHPACDSYLNLCVLGGRKLWTAFDPCLRLWLTLVMNVCPIHNSLSVPMSDFCLILWLILVRSCNGLLLAPGSYHCGNLRLVSALVCD